MDAHSLPWNAVLLIGGAGYLAGAFSVCLVLGLLRVLRRAGALID